MVAEKQKALVLRAFALFKLSRPVHDLKLALVHALNHDADARDSRQPLCKRPILNQHLVDALKLLDADLSLILLLPWVRLGGSGDVRHEAMCPVLGVGTEGADPAINSGDQGALVSALLPMIPITTLGAREGVQLGSLAGVGLVLIERLHGFNGEWGMDLFECHMASFVLVTMAALLR